MKLSELWRTIARAKARVARLSLRLWQSAMHSRQLRSLYPSPVMQAKANLQISEEQVAQYWDQNADAWANQLGKGYDVYRDLYNNPAFYSFVGSVEGRAVLDAGCGEGYNTRHFARTGARMFGVDISKRMIQIARQEEQREPLGISYEVASFSDLSIFGTPTFDMVISFMALMDGPNLEGALKEMARVLKPTGDLVIAVLHPCFFTGGFGWILDKKGIRSKLTVAHYFDSSPRLDEFKFYESSAPKDSAPFVVPRFLRTLSDYFNSVIQVGLELKEIHEPRAPEDMVSQYPWLQFYREHASLYLYLRARKI
jgi:SAM-dependent methyltransferase